MSTVSLLSDVKLPPATAAVFADIRPTRQIDLINNFWCARGARQEVPGDE